MLDSPHLCKHCICREDVYLILEQKICCIVIVLLCKQDTVNVLAIFCIVSIYLSLISTIPRASVSLIYLYIVYMLLLSTIEPGIIRPHDCLYAIGMLYCNTTHIINLRENGQCLTQYQHINFVKHLHHSN